MCKLEMQLTTDAFRFIAPHLNLSIQNMPILSTLCALPLLLNTSKCIELTEYKSAVECATSVVTKFDEQRKIINYICGGLFNDELKKTKPAFRKNLLCLRHELATVNDSLQARKVVEKCATDFPSIESTLYASNLMTSSFLTPEQRQIKILQEQNERINERIADAQRERDHQNRIQQIDQDYQNRMRQIDQDYQNRMREINQNRPFNCIVNGNYVSCN